MTTLPAIALSDPAELDLVAYRGDTGRFRVTVTEGGAPLDVSAAVWDCDVRATPDGPVLATMTVTPVVGTTNAVDVVLPAEQSALITTTTSGPDQADTDTTVAVWDLEMTLGTDPDTTTTTLLRGTFTATKDVSRPAMTEPPEGGGPESPLLLSGAPQAMPEAAQPPPVLAGSGLVHSGPDVEAHSTASPNGA